MKGTCRLCGRPGTFLVYSGPIRAGGAESGVLEGFSILGCAHCGIQFLDPFPQDTQGYYTGKQYWQDHHGPVDIAKLQTKHGAEQRRWFYEVSAQTLRGQNLVDFGCGAGIFLDMSKGIANETVGVDLALHFQDHLEKSGHRFESDTRQLEDSHFDVAVSFDTLEHVPDPVSFLKEIYRVLKPGGQLFIGVPNQNDLLKRLVPEYLSFFYHLSHLYYFNSQALVLALKDSGFDDIQVAYVHKYDLTNMIVWARDRKGVGTPGSDLFDRYTEESFRSNLERQGIASHLFVRAGK